MSHDNTNPGLYTLEKKSEGKWEEKCFDIKTPDFSDCNKIITESKPTISDEEMFQILDNTGDIPGISLHEYVQSTLDVDREKLSIESTKEAVKDKVHSYPQTIKSICDKPIDGQQYSLLTLLMSKRPAILNGNKDSPIWGFLKIRGGFSTKELAKEEATRIIKKQDSKNIIRIVRTGAWFPITDNQSFVKDKHDVYDEDQVYRLRGSVTKEKEEEAERALIYMKERAKVLTEEQGNCNNCDTLEFYIKNRNIELKLGERVEVETHKLADLKETITKKHILLRMMEKRNPQYKDEWIPVYNSKLQESGIPLFVPREGQFDEYDSRSLESLKQEYPELYESVLESYNSKTC